MRVGACLLVFLFALVPAAGARVHKTAPVAIFYYPWYGTPAHDGAYQHWQQNGHTPPSDIASSFYPARGVYSSSDTKVLDGQMREIARAGIGEIVTTWWGRGSAEDVRLPARDPSRACARRCGGRAPRAVRGPHGRRHRARRRVPANARDPRLLRLPRNRLPRDRVAGADHDAVGRAALRADAAASGLRRAGGFQGVYTYDILTYRGRTFARLCNQAHRQHLLCAPSVGPGYSARRATGDTRVVARRGGKTYDAMWRAALGAHADLADDHELQRVARGNADRAARGSATATRATTARGQARPSRGDCVPRAHDALVAAVHRLAVSHVMRVRTRKAPRPHHVASAA